MRLGDARTKAGDTVAGRTCYEQVAVLARAIGDPTMLADAALAHVTRGSPVRLGFGALIVASIFDSWTRSVALLEEAEQALPPEDSSLRARTLARLATELYQFRQKDRSIALSQEAVDMALRIGDPQALVEALHGRHWATLSPDSIDERLANAQEMLLVATGAANEEAAFLARHARLHCHLELCDISAVDAELMAMEQLSARIQQPFYLWHVACLHGMRALLHGRAAEAERIVGDALAWGRVRRSEYVTYMYEDAQIVAIRWTQGRMEEVRDRIRDHGERYPEIPRWRDALVAAELGDHRAARAEIERHERHGFMDLPRGGLWILHACALAQACVLIGDERRAELLYDQLAPFADRNAISISTLAFGPVSMRLGSLAASLGRWEQAERHFTDAQGLCDSLGARAITAMLLVERARMFWPAPDAATSNELAPPSSRACRPPTTSVCPASRSVPARSLRSGGRRPQGPRPRVRGRPSPERRRCSGERGVTGPCAIEGRWLGSRTARGCGTSPSSCTRRDGRCTCSS